MIARRRYIHPAPEDTWDTIAARELADHPLAEAVGKLQSWNLHVFARAPGPAGSPRAGNPILPSDILFIEPPLPL